MPSIPRLAPARRPCSTPSGGIARQRKPADAARPRRGADAAGRQRDADRRHVVCQTRPHRGDDRTRQLHRACASASPRRAASRLPPTSPRSASRPCPAYAAPHIADDDTTPVVAAIDARHNHVYLQAFAPGGRTLIAPRLAPLSEAVRAAAESAGAHCRQRRAELSPTAVAIRALPRRDRRSRRARHRLGRTAGAAMPETRRRQSRYICARPTRSRRTPRNCRADDRASFPVCSAAPRRAYRRRARRTPQPSPVCTRRRFSAAGARTKSTAC